MGEFCIFIPNNNSIHDATSITTSNLDQFINERNSVSVLQNSCAKSKCKLEFEIKSKASSSSNKTMRITGDQALYEDTDEDNNTNNDAQSKIK